MERELRVLVDIVLCRVLHEFAANRLDLLGQSGRKHHHLLLRRRGTEDVLNIRAHI